MTISSANSSPISSWKTVLEQIEEDSGESQYETNEETASDDAAAPRPVEYRGDQPMPPPGPYQQPVIPGSILNVKA